MPVHGCICLRCCRAGLEYVLSRVKVNVSTTLCLITQKLSVITENRRLIMKHVITVIVPDVRLWSWSLALFPLSDGRHHRSHAGRKERDSHPDRQELFVQDSQCVFRCVQMIIYESNSRDSSYLYTTAFLLFLFINVSFYLSIYL